MTKRYVAGLSVKDGAPVGHLVVLEEDENGERLGQAFLANDMSYEQVDHLHMQVGKLKTIMQPPAGEVTDSGVQITTEDGMRVTMGRDDHGCIMVRLAMDDGRPAVTFCLTVGEAQEFINGLITTNGDAQPGAEE